MPFKNKIALVTGGAGGIGKSISIRLAQEGVNVIISGRNKEKGKSAIKTIIEKGGNASFIYADLSVSKDIKKMVNSIFNTFGKLDILVNNAAISGYMGPVIETPIEEFENVLNVNLISIFHLSKLVLPKMVENEYGRIINISSIAYRTNSPNSATYNISKAGLNTFTKTLSKEVAHAGITVNAIAPGLVLTERIIKSRLPGMAQKSGVSPEDMLNKITSDTDTKRLTKEEDIAELVVFLSSKFSQNITGEIINIAGGF